MISNALINDLDLDPFSKGVLIYMLAKPPTWKTYPSYLAKTLRIGRDKIYSTLKKLEKLGYLTVQKEKNEKGQYCGVHYFFHESPRENPHTDFQEMDSQGEKPLPENPDVENTHNNNKRLLEKTDIYRERKKEITDAASAALISPPIEFIKIEREKGIKTTEDEHNKLVAEHGEEQTKLFYLELSEWKEINKDKARRLKSDYRAITKWVIHAVKERQIKAEELKQREERLKRIESTSHAAKTPGVQPINLGYGKYDYTPINRAWAEQKIEEDEEIRRLGIKVYGTIVGHDYIPNTDVYLNQHPDEFKRKFDSLTLKLKQNVSYV
jgi:predicted transcriptional regulator